jgi:hypothetical protein
MLSAKRAFLLRLSVILQIIHLETLFLRGIAYNLS